MPNMKSFIKLILYGGLTCEEYKIIKPVIISKNRRSLILAIRVVCILLFLLSIGSFLFEPLIKLRIIYILLFFTAVTIYIILYFFRRNNKIVFPLFYLSMTLSFIFGIIIGVPYMPDFMATTFCVLLFVFPLLIIDQPYRVVIMLAAVSFVFCVSSAICKPWNIAYRDIINGICFFILSSVINNFVMYTKINDTQNRIHIERERDTDDLTKLMTKSAALREIDRYIKNTGNPAALLVLDIDNFKQVNDRMGHAYGDAVLRIMGNCIRDIFRNGNVLSRFRGDEFMLFLLNANSQKAVSNRIGELIKHMNKQLVFTDSSFTITSSIGIAFYPQDAQSYEELFKKADAALYCSKATGKNCYTFYLDSYFISHS